MSKTNTASVATVSAVAEVARLEAERKAKAKALKTAQERQAWEEATKARNPAYVIGSRRPVTDADRSVLGHVHGAEVCEIECQACGTRRVINCQDAFQSKFCPDCKKSANKEQAKVKRAEKRLAGKSPEQIQAEIAALEAQLSALQS